MALGVSLFFPCSFKVTCMSSHVINMCLEKICAMKMLLTFLQRSRKHLRHLAFTTPMFQSFLLFLAKMLSKYVLAHEKESRKRKHTLPWFILDITLQNLFSPYTDAVKKNVKKNGKHVDTTLFITSPPSKSVICPHQSNKNLWKNNFLPRT